MNLFEGNCKPPQKRRTAIRRGMAKAAQRGRPIGRPTQAEADLLMKYAPVRQAAKATGVAVNTVRKVQKLMT